MQPMQEHIQAYLRTCIPTCIAFSVIFTESTEERNRKRMMSLAFTSCLCLLTEFIHYNNYIILLLTFSHTAVEGVNTP